MKYSVNDNCISCGLCTSTCPEVFSMGDTKAVAIEDEVDSTLEESAERALAECPVNAIEHA